MSAPSAPVQWFDGKTYYNSGSYASPTWVLVPNIGDIEVTDETELKGVPLRSMANFKGYVAGERDVGFKWKMIYNPADTGQTAMRTAYRSRAGMEFLFLDQAIGVSGATGLRATFTFAKFRRIENETPMMVEAEIKPYAGAANAPEEYTSS